jgi:hypothetical protein
LDETIHNIKKNTEQLYVTGKGDGIEVNTNKTECTVMSRD